MTVERVDYIVRISFSAEAEVRSPPLVERSASIIERLLAYLAAEADEAEVIHRRVFEAPVPRRQPAAWIPLPCVRCRRFGPVSVERYCTACWAATR
jgi:hypothetical protein